MKDIASKSNFPTGDYTVDSTDINSMVNELEGAVTNFGQTLAAADNAQLRKSLMIAGIRASACTDSSVTANTVTAAPIYSNAPDTLLDGMSVLVKVANSNTGAVTLAYNGTTAKAVQSLGGAAMTSGQIVANRWYSFIYNSTADAWVLDITANASTTAAGILEVATLAEIVAAAPGQQDANAVNPFGLRDFMGGARPVCMFVVSGSTLVARFGVAGISAISAVQNNVANTWTLTVTFTSLPVVLSNTTGPGGLRNYVFHASRAEGNFTGQSISGATITATYGYATNSNDLSTDAQVVGTLWMSY